MNFNSPVTRFLLGVVFPFFLELMIYQSYLFLKPNRNPDFLLSIFLIPILLPLIFFYFVSPYFIYSLSGTGRKYSESLNLSINEIFITKKEILSQQEIETIGKELRQTLIPELTRRFRANYVNHFFQQSHAKGHDIDSVLGFYETILLFAVFSFALSLINGILAIFLNFFSINIEQIVIVDQISNITNVLLTAIFMFILSLSSFLLIILVQRRIQNIIPLVVQGWVNTVENERLEILQLQIQALSDFNFEDLLSSQLIESKDFMTAIYLDLLKDKINEVSNIVSRDQAGKKLAWRRYAEILTNLGISEKKKEQIEDSFLSGSLITKFSYDQREFESVKEDLSFFHSRLESWQEQSDNDRLRAFLLLYRSAESIFRGILRNQGSPQGNFGTMILTLAEMKLISNEEQIILNKVRRQRNLMLHRAGEKINITKSFAQSFLESIESILLNAGNIIGNKLK